MTRYNPEIHHRRSIRLKGYDYSRAGLYFITIVTQNRACLFGHVENQQMVLNDAGLMIKKWYDELENKFDDVRCLEMIIMPNHFHCIVENVGADLSVCPNKENRTISGGEHAGSSLTGSSLSTIVQWFKTMTTNEYIRGVKNKQWPRFNGKLWQRNYWEHIIRNDDAYYRIAQYIINNPAKWDNDKLK